MGRITPRRLIAFAAASATALVTALVAPPAWADTAPEDPATTPETVAADALPTVQINGVVWDQLILGNTVYAVGNFSTARPAGAAPGTNTVARGNMLAYNLQTGALITTWAPTSNAQVLSIDASPDGSRLYIAGDFTSVNGQTQYRVAALSPTTGAVLPGFRPGLNFKARDITVTSDAIYVAGAFSAVGSQERRGFAAFSTTNGALLPWAPRVDDGRGFGVEISPDGSKAAVIGSFTSLNGSSNPGYGLALVDTATGATLPTPANGLIRNAGDDSALTTISSDENAFYVGGYHYGAGGNLEGFAKISWSGETQLVNDCHGDTYGVVPRGDVVYTATHHHYCNNVDGGFPQTDPWTFHHGNAFTNYPTVPLKHDQVGYFDWFGTPGPTMLYFYPAFQPGTFTGANQGPWAVAANDDYVVYGGEFTHVNGQRQQGLVRMADKEIAPNAQGPRRVGEDFELRAASFVEGQVRVSWPANWDRDNQTLTYRLYRGGMGAPPIHEESVTAPFWDLPAMGFTDTGLEPGSTQRYRVTATDAFGNTAGSAWVEVTVAAEGSLSDYAATVLEDDASSYWRLGEPEGTTVFDWAGFHDAVASEGVTRGAAGAIGDDTDAASTFSGTSTGFAATQNPVDGPQTFTVETWVRTTTTRGGKILGFGSSATGNSGSYDRHLYMDNSGRIWFGVYPGGVRTLNTTASYNDGQWHHVVATLGSNGMRLYVDGKRQAIRTDVTSAQGYAGYWRIGGDNINGWPSQPSSSYLEGSIDDVAVYPQVLGAEDVLAHYTASGRTADVPPVPADTYGAAIRAAGPDLYWRLGELSGTTAHDTTLNDSRGTFRNGVTLGTAGAIADVADTAVTFDGVDDQLSSDQAWVNPTTYSEELWFRTTTTNGGKLIGLGAQQTGLSSNYDRHVYMETDGRLTFGVWTGQTNTITSDQAYNDGTWHHMVATQSSEGMRLYVDGVLVGTNPQTQAESYTGYWKVGGDTTWGPQPWFAGSIDEIAVYSYALTAQDVANHHAFGTTGAPPNQMPVAAFTHTVDQLTVDFDASGSSDPDGTVASYSWVFGDGATSTGPTPTHTYAAGGTYTVTLTVTDDGGATSSVSHDVVAVDPPPNQAPTAAFTADVTLLDLEVDASASSDPDGTVASYAWEFGDGATGTGVTASHTYAAAGTYTVTLTVTDDEGATAVTTEQVEATEPPPNQAPTAAFTAVVDELDVQVDASASSDPDGTVASYAWEFGDGATGTGVTASHTYAAAGTYTVTLTVTDDEGATAVTTEQVEATEPPAVTELAADAFGRTTSNGWGTADLGGAWSSTNPQSIYSVSGGQGHHLLNVAGRTAVSALNDVSSDDTEVRVQVALDKAQTGGGTYLVVAARRTATGEYSGRARVMSNGAVVLSAMRDGTALRSLVAPFTYTAGLELEMRVQATGTSPTTIRAKVWPAGTAEPADWQVEATDSTAGLQGPGAVRLTSYLSGSATNAPVTASWDDLLVLPTTATPPPANQAPQAAFTPSVSGLGVSVDGSASSDADGTVASYAWAFGDGATATGATASHTYGAAGTYTVTLTVTDDDGATGTVSQDVTVSDAPPPNQAPQAEFAAAATLLDLEVDASASSDADGTVASYAWTFGDGGTATGVTASHTYGAAGTYTVTLTVTDDDGATGTVSQDVTVSDAPPVNQAPQAAFTPSVSGLEVSVDGSASSDPDGSVASYAWAFGDGATATGATASHTYGGAGTYTVTLTVTDDDGATGTVSQDVTVTEPPAVDELARDTFERAVPAGWGDAEVGGTWSTFGSGALYAVESGAGVHRLDVPGRTTLSYLPGVSSTDTDVAVTVSLDKDPTGGGVYLGLVGRQVTMTDGYQARLRLFAGGSASLYLLRGGTTLAAVPLPDVSYAAGDQVRVRLQVVGTAPTVLRAKAWEVTTTEPTDWQVTTTDAAASLQTAGGVGFTAYLSGSTGNAPVAARWDDLLAVTSEP